MGNKDIESRARQKAEKAAMQEAMANNIMIWFPLLFVAIIMILGGAPIELSVLFAALALVAGAVSAMVTWKGSYKRHYENYLAELATLKVKCGKNED